MGEPVKMRRYGRLTYLDQVFGALGTLVLDRGAFVQDSDAIGVELHKPLRRCRTLGRAESLCVHHQNVQEPRLALVRISNLLYRLTELLGEVGLPFDNFCLNALRQMRGYFFLTQLSNTPFGAITKAVLISFASYSAPIVSIATFDFPVPISMNRPK